MINTKFEAYKIQRELRKVGKEYEFKRAKKNQFKEPTKDEIPVGKIIGLYHEKSDNVSIITGDTARVRSKKVPMILCLYKDVESLKLEIGDIVEINSKIFNVIGIVNIQEWSIIADISLEVIDYGVQA